MPPEATPVPELVTPEISPPDRTFSTPVSVTYVLLVIVPATFMVTPLDTVMLCAVPPAETFRTPPFQAVT